MNQETESKPVPRAERAAGDYWTFTLPDGASGGYEEEWLRKLGHEKYVWAGGPTAGYFLALIESAKLREELAESGMFYNDLRDKWDQDRKDMHAASAELIANGNRVAAELGLPEGSGVDEVIGRIKEITRPLESLAEDYGLEFSEDYEDAPNWEPLDTWRWVLSVIQKNLKAKPRPGEKATDLAAGPSAIPAQLQTLRKVLGCESMPDVQAIQLAVAIASEHKQTLRQIAHLGTFIGHPGATPAHVVSETVSLIEGLQVKIGESQKTNKSAFREKLHWKEQMESYKQRALAAEGLVEQIRVGCQTPEGTEVSEIPGFVKWLVDERHAWTQRALVAEARLPGGPEEKSWLDEFYAQIEKGKALCREWEESMRKSQIVSQAEYGDGEVSVANHTGASGGLLSPVHIELPVGFRKFKIIPEK